MAKEQSVFVSYSSQDREIVNKIVSMLKAEGIDYWKAPEMIPAGSSYAREIPRAIKECQVFLLVLSRTSQESIWVEKETDSAISNHKTIIPFQIDASPLNDTFRFYLNNVQMISYAADKEGAVLELKGHLHHLLKRMSEDEMVTQREMVKSSQMQGDLSEEPADKEVPFSRKRGSVKADSNALRINRIPLECDYCGSKMLENITMGTYRCLECGKDSYDDFQTIRNYLAKVGNAPATVIERNTGVPRRIIKHFFQDEYLEIPKNSSVRVPCERCGAPIRTGVLCDACKAKSVGDKNAGRNKDARKGSWHTLY